jgi:UDP-N-acetylglucosamine--N-acetylmuramyl-(pentapeptide) pyrophosphoryl-undecaprenol N-acetylglucosamine transferase
MKNKLRIIISGGGTGGHIYPAIAVAQAIEKELNGAVEFLFVGAKDRMEMEKVPKAGYPIVGLWISGLQRSLSIKNMLFPFKVIVAVLKSWLLIGQFKPDLAIGFGGYASGAMMFAAWMRGIPVMIHEQNSYAGITNKLLKNKAKKVAVAYSQMDRFFPAAKIVLTGNPVRTDILSANAKKSAAVAFFKLDETKKTVLVIGGSLGARTINQTLFNNWQQLTNAGYNLIWQKGNNFPAADQLNHPNLVVRNFIYEMDLAYAMADIVVSRAGALSIAEIAIVAKPLILVPSPNVAEDHQTKNALALVNENAALMVKDAAANQELITTVLGLLSDTNKQTSLANHIATFSKPDAAQLIAKEALQLVNTHAIN